MYRIRKSTMDDIDRIEEIYNDARRRMAESGNKKQWSNGHPGRGDVIKGVEDGSGYVIEENGVVIGVFAFYTEPDPTYGYIENGSWLSESPYGTIHRIASDGIHHGILKTVTKFGQTMADNIRLDTHEDNKIMQRAAEKLGYSKRGIIYLLNGDPRIAYEKIGK